MHRETGVEKFSSNKLVLLTNLSLMNCSSQHPTFDLLRHPTYFLQLFQKINEHDLRSELLHELVLDVYIKCSSCKGQVPSARIIGYSFDHSSLHKHLAFINSSAFPFFRIFLLVFVNGQTSHIDNFTRRHHLETKKTLE